MQKVPDRKRQELFICPQIRKGSDIIARKETLEQLKARAERLDSELKKKQEARKKLDAKLATMTRNQRAHRLCKHGAVLEKYLSPDEFTTEQIATILELLFRDRDNQTIIANVKHQANKPPDSNTPNSTARPWP